MQNATTIEGAIVSLLTGDAATAAIVAGRVHPSSVPEPTFPKATFSRWGTDRATDIGGFSNDGPTGYAQAKFLIDCWAADLLTAKTLASAVRRVLNGYAGTVGPLSIGCARVVDEREQPGEPVPGRDVPVQRVTLDVRVSFTDV